MKTPWIFIVSSAIFILLLPKSQASNFSFSPLIQHFSSEEMPGHFQNWCASTASSGLWLICNGGGILLYDGQSWQLLRTPNDERVTTLNIDEKSGRIYTGFSHHIGYFFIDKNNEWQFHQLNPKNLQLKESMPFSSINTIQKLSSGLAYLSDHQLLFKTEKGAISTFPISELPTRHMLKMNNKLLIFDPKQGPRFFDPNKGLLPASDKLVVLKNRYVISSAEVNSKQFVLGTYASGLYLLEQQSIKKIPFNRQQVNTALALIDKNTLAIGTQRQGIFIINLKGKLLKHISMRGLGVKSGEITGLSYDSTTQSLLATSDSKGLFQIIAPLGINQLTLSDNYDNSTAIIEYDSKTIIGLRSGLEKSSLYAEIDSNIGKRFKPFKKNFHAWHFTKFKEFLIATSGNTLSIFNRGLEVVREFRFGELQANHTFALALHDKNQILALFGKNVYKIRYENQSFFLDPKSVSLPRNGTKLLQKDTYLWVSTHSSDLFRLSYRDSWPPLDLEYFNSDHGLHNGSNQTILVNGQFYIANSKQGIFRFDDKEKQFFPAEGNLGSRFSKIPLFHLAQNQQWLANFELSDEGRAQLSIVNKITLETEKEKEKAITINYLPFLKEKFVTDIALDDNNRLLIAGRKHNYAIDLDKVGHFQIPNIFIEAIATNDKNLFLHHRFSKQENTIRLAPNQRTIHLEASLIDTLPNRNNQFRFFDGSTWTPWQESNRIQLRLNRLDAYELRVEARSRHHRAASETRIPIVVSRHWYEKSWAKFLMALIALTLILLVAKVYALYQHRRLIHEKNRLTKLVNERTQTIKTQSEKLVNLEKSRNKLFSNVSHEFRTPLTLILSPLDTLLGKVENNEFAVNEFKKKINVARSNAKRVLDLVNQILDINRLEHHSLQLNRSNQNFTVFIRTISENFSSFAEEKQITLDLSQVDDNIFYVFDPYYMERILYNLLSNAFKFTDPGGQIQILLTNLSETINLTVADNGRGMSEEQKEQAFNRFFQADSQFDPMKPGTGIGLSFVQELVKLHGGTINCQSTLGKGSSFKITFPQVNIFDSGKNTIVNHERSSDFEAKSLGQNSVGQLDKKTLLVIEDNDELRELICSLFEGQFIVQEARNGQEGLKFARQDLPDAIICDLMMPILDGFQVVGELKGSANTNYIPILVLTAKANKPDTVKTLNLGADDYLTKPFDNQELSARVTGLIASRESLKRRFSDSEHLADSISGTFLVPLLHENQLTDQSHVDYATYKKAVTLIRKNISESDFSVQALAKLMAMDRSSLYRRLNHVISISPQQLIRDVRLSEAALLLKQNSGNVSEVAYGVGFSSIAYFSRSFKKAFAHSPSEY